MRGERRAKTVRELLLEELRRQREERAPKEARVRIPKPPPERWRPRAIPPERAMAEMGVEPLYPELWDLASACNDKMRCYSALVELWKERNNHEYIRMAAMAGADIEQVINLLKEGKKKEVFKLAGL
ncbi:hypothetical protein [Pyrobaculum aerophilum]|uniref:Uncharacterized protein n=1 Tax=Pyrobaculum aerophilum TaxID=13773 RepID=A0A371QX89_9CREN|nr:hypothetical protein [Pyrobaculum aerophilum]RFA95036.1 hypothetical protein CGL51_08620 [Pyrobaculum aerophilum]